MPAPSPLTWRNELVTHIFMRTHHTYAWSKLMSFQLFICVAHVLTQPKLHLTKETHWHHHRLHRSQWKSNKQAWYKLRAPLLSKNIHDFIEHLNKKKKKKHWCPLINTRYYLLFNSTGQSLFFSCSLHQLPLQSLPFRQDVCGSSSAWFCCMSGFGSGAHSDPRPENLVQAVQSCCDSSVNTSSQLLI